MKVKPWQGCALLLDMNPDDLRFDRNSWMAGPGPAIFDERSFPSKEIKAQFDKRLRLILANLSSFEVSSVDMAHAGLCEMTTAAFAKGALSLDLEMPNELREIGRTDDSRRLSPAPVPQEKALAAKERESLLKMVIGMATKGYRYDADAKRTDVTGEISRDLEDLGIGLDPDTVRKFLREGAALLPKKAK